MANQTDGAAATTGRRWLASSGLVVTMALSLATTAAAKPPSGEGAMMRMLACEGDGGGGTVDFDQRFGKRAKCGPFQSQDPSFGN